MQTCSLDYRSLSSHVWWSSSSPSVWRWHRWPHWIQTSSSGVLPRLEELLCAVAHIAFETHSKCFVSILKISINKVESLVLINKGGGATYQKKKKKEGVLLRVPEGAGELPEIHQPSPQKDELPDWGDENFRCSTALPCQLVMNPSLSISAKSSQFCSGKML